MKYLLSLMLAATMTCKTVYEKAFVYIERCENNEVICYINLFKGGVECKFKEQSDVAED